ncbi:MAG: hypothetical protein GY765_11295 [bacterium]|nr:hypothetical protein [bacterium]
MGNVSLDTTNHEFKKLRKNSDGSEVMKCANCNLEGTREKGRRAVWFDREKLETGLISISQVNDCPNEPSGLKSEDGIKVLCPKCGEWAPICGKTYFCAKCNWDGKYKKGTTVTLGKTDHKMELKETSAQGDTFKCTGCGLEGFRQGDTKTLTVTKGKKKAASCPDADNTIDKESTNHDLKRSKGDSYKCKACGLEGVYQGEGLIKVTKEIEHADDCPYEPTGLVISESGISNAICPKCGTLAPENAKGYRCLKCDWSGKYKAGATVYKGLEESAEETVEAVVVDDDTNEFDVLEDIEDNEEPLKSDKLLAVINHPPPVANGYDLTDRDSCMKYIGTLEALDAMANLSNYMKVQILKTMKEGKKYKDAGFNTFKDFCKSIHISKSQGYSLLAELEESGSKAFISMSKIGLKPKHLNLLKNPKIEVNTTKKNKKTIVFPASLIGTEHEIEFTEDNKELIEEMLARVERNLKKISAEKDRIKEEKQKAEKKTREMEQQKGLTHTEDSFRREFATVHGAFMDNVKKLESLAERASVSGSGLIKKSFASQLGALEQFFQGSLDDIHQKAK